MTKTRKIGYTVVIILAALVIYGLSKMSYQDAHFLDDITDPNKVMEMGSSFVSKKDAVGKYAHLQNMSQEQAYELLFQNDKTDQEEKDIVSSSILLKVSETYTPSLEVYAQIDKMKDDDDYTMKQIDALILDRFSKDGNQLAFDGSVTFTLNNDHEFEYHIDGNFMEGKQVEEPSTYGPIQIGETKTYTYHCEADESSTKLPYNFGFVVNTDPLQDGAVKVKMKN